MIKCVKCGLALALLCVIENIQDGHSTAGDRSQSLPGWTETAVVFTANTQFNVSSCQLFKLCVYFLMANLCIDA